MKLLLVDGSNVIMRAAFGGKLPPEQAVPVALGLIERAIRQTQATHLIVALDSPTPSWRHKEFPDYKAHRETDTAPWLEAAYDGWVRHGWYVALLPGYEADDIIATLATRTQGRCGVTVVSSDSDLFCLLAQPGIEFFKPVDGGKFLPVTATEVCAKFEIGAVALLPEYKALTGDAGDNVPGVPGIGKVRAARALQAYGTLEGVITAGQERKCPASIAVAANEARVRRALRLVTLTKDAPVAPVAPGQCRL